MNQLHIREVIIPFFFSRALFFVVLILSSFITVENVPAREGLNFNLTFSRSTEEASTRLKKTLLSADASWYIEIAKYGYPKDRGDTLTPRHWVFFPAFPLLVKLLLKILNHPLLISTFLNLILFFGALLLLSKYLSAEGFDINDNKFILRSICFHPLSYFFSTPHSEAVFFFAIVSLLYFLKYSPRQLATIMVSSALFFSSRPTSILLIPAILTIVGASKTKINHLTVVFLGFLSFICYSYFLKQLTGSYLAWIMNQETWGRSVTSFLPSSISFKNIDLVSAWSFGALHFYYLILVFFAAGYFLYKKNLGYFLILASPTLFALKSGSLLSLSRILLPLFPLNLFLTRLFRSETSRATYLLISSFLYGIMVLLYCLHVTLAMT